MKKGVKFHMLSKNPLLPIPLKKDFLEFLHHPQDLLIEIKRVRTPNPCVKSKPFYSK